jgi:CDP-diacylglycerol---glycerol-3-phosphate 3-phosphatidyltransferase
METDSSLLVLAILQRKTFGLMAFAALALSGGYVLLRTVWNPAYALQWVIVAALITAYESTILWRGLFKNRPTEGADLYSTFGLGNIFSLTRGLLLAGLGGFLFLPWPDGWLAWAPGVLYIAADLLDYCDGLAARLTRHTTLLGEHLDLEYDSVNVLVGPLLGIWYGQLPLWYLLICAARYLFIAGIWLLKRQGKLVHDLPPSILRRSLAGFQMSFMAVVLLPVFSPPGTWVAAAVFGLPFLAGFLRDWLVVSGWLDPASVRYKKVTALTEKLFSIGVLPLLRLITLVIGIQAGSSLLNNSPVCAVFYIVSSLLIGSGTAARSVALLQIIATGLLLSSGLISGLMLIGCAAAIIMLGSGSFSLWKPEEDFVTRRYGEDGA